MLKKSLFLATIISCFTINAHPVTLPADHHTQKFQEYGHNIEPAKNTTDLHTKKLQEKEETKKSKYPHTDFCFCGAVTGVVMIASSFLIPAQQETKDNLFKAGWAVLLGSGAIGTASILNENWHAITDKK